MDYFNNATPNFNPSPQEEEQVKADRERMQAEQAAMEQQQQLAKQQQAAQQKAAQQEAQPKADSLGERVKESVVAGVTPLLGTTDFITDAMGMVPWLKPVDEWWDKNSPRSKNPLVGAVRSIASVAIPTFLGSRFTIGKLGAATAGVELPKAVRLLGSVAAAAGVDTAVTGISATSEGDNAAGQLNQMLGNNFLPWGTLPEDSPDVKRQKNMMEAAGLSVGTDLLSAMFSLRKGFLKLIPKDEESAIIIKANEDLGQGAKLADSKGKPVPSDNDIDPITSAVENRQMSREEQLIKEGASILENDPDGGFNPKLNTQLADPEEIPMTGVGANAVQAKIDNFLIQRNITTLDGQMTPPITRESELIFDVAQGDKSARANKLEEMFGTIRPNADVLVGKKLYDAAEINKATDKLTGVMLDPAIGIKEFVDIVDNTKKAVYEGVKLLGEAEWVAAYGSFKQLFEAIEPNNVRASAMISQGIANDVTNLSWAVRNIGDYADTTAQQKLIWEKLAVLGGEIRANQRAAGITLQLKKLQSKGTSWEGVTAFTKQANEAFSESLAATKAEGAASVKKLQAIAEQNPEMLKAIYPVFEASNGRIDDMAKFFRFAENYAGVLGKGIVDMGDPQVASAFVKGLQQVRYNNILFGKAMVNAGAGNAVNMILKPTSALLGSIGRDSTTFKRSLWGYGGISENFKRGMKAMSDEWAVIRRSPEAAAMGRPDDPEDTLQLIESMDYAASKWLEKGDLGRVAAWNMTKLMSGYNGNSIVRFGTDTLKAVDVFTRSFAQSGAARFRAYDDILNAGGDKMSAAEFKKAFSVKQDELYKSAFDESGLLRNVFGEADFSAKEMSLSIDNELVSRLEGIMERVPAAKTLFMFPKTGLNALEMAWSYAPVSGLNASIGRVRRALKASTADEISEVLMEHGFKPDKMADPDMAFAAIKSEYIGRQIMGASVVTGAALWALEGNLTGNGPQDGAENRRMISQGWKPRSIRNPVDGSWHSYEGLEPFSLLLGLVGDAMYQTNRVDQAVSEDWFKKLSFAISQNISNKTFLSGFQVLTDLISGDEGAFQRFFAMQVDTAIPLTGMRSLLSKAVTPQLKDVENDFVNYLANRNKFLFGPDEELKDMRDIYTGKPIQHWEPFIAAANALTPFFKTNGGTEPWREWLIKTGWDGLKNVVENPISKTKVTPEQRQWVNNWIATNADLAGQIEQMRTAPDGFWDKQIKEYVKRRGQQTQKEYPIKELVTHEMLTKIHNDAWIAAWNAYAAENQEALNAGRLAGMRNKQLNIGDQQGASETQRQLEVLLAYPK